MSIQSPFAALKHMYWDWAASQQKKRRRHAELTRLRQDPHPLARTLAEAIEKTIAGQYGADEAVIIRDIEGLRRRLSDSDVEIEHIDYGAGEPTDPKSVADAEQGVRRIFKLADLAKSTSKDSPWIDLIFNLVRMLKPRNCLELGTCIGLSASYQGAAMKLNGEGRIVTLEGGENFARIAEENMRSLGLANHKIVVGRFEDTLDKVLANEGPFDFMFNDGHHDGDAMLAYFKRSVPAFSEHAVMVFDDIRAYESMKRGWQRLANDEHVALAIDFGQMGLICLGPAAGTKSSYTLPLR